MEYQTNKDGKILNMDKRGVWHLASDGKPYEFRADTLPSGNKTGIVLPVCSRDVSRAGTTIVVGPSSYRWEIRFNDNGYVAQMSNITKRK